MTLGRIVALFADVHGADRALSQALNRCRAEGVATVALLGDLFDRVEQADACALALAGWDVVGVYGNHEREAARAAAAGAARLLPPTVHLLDALCERLVIDDVCLVHEEPHWGHHDPLAALFGARAPANGRRDHARITFTGHTHYRHARDERGPLDLGRGVLTIEPARRYLINPGALAGGQYAVWDREAGVVWFRQVGA